MTRVTFAATQKPDGSFNVNCSAITHMPLTSALLQLDRRPWRSYVSSSVSVSLLELFESDPLKEKNQTLSCRVPVICQR